MESDTSRSTGQPAGPPDPRSGVLATFDVLGDRFRVWVTNPQTIQQILDLRDGKSQANIPSGRIHEGPGRGEHNAPWRWHLDPEDIEMAEAAIEVCDGLPSYVNEHLDDFIALGRYCPWQAALVDVRDAR